MSLRKIFAKKERSEGYCRLDLTINYSPIYLGYSAHDFLTFQQMDLHGKGRVIYYGPTFHRNLVQDKICLSVHSSTVIGRRKRVIRPRVFSAKKAFDVDDGLNSIYNTPYIRTPNYAIFYETPTTKKMSQK